MDPAPHHRSPAEERAYLFRRSEEHRRCAAASEEPLQRALHEDFAMRYQERAKAILVDGD